MTLCHQCGGTMGVEPSCFRGWQLLACATCHRPIKLILISGPRPRSTPIKRSDLNRALRANRRMKLRQSQ